MSTSSLLVGDSPHVRSPLITHALRSLRRTPVFAVAAALTLALGIGSAAAAFAIAYGVLFDPLPFGRPDRLVSIGLRTTEVQRIQQPPAIYHVDPTVALRAD